MDNRVFGGGFTLRAVTIIIFVSLLVTGMFFSIYLFYIANSLYMLVVAAGFGALSIFAGFFNFYASILYYRSYFYDGYLDKIRKGLKKPKVWPSVAIIMPVYNENPKTVESTFRTLLKMRYPKERLAYYVLDDSTKPETANEIKSFAKSHGIRYIHRMDRRGFKAGAFNNMLKYSNEKFIAIFDYDERLVNRNFLLDIMPYFGDAKLSYVQTEKTCRKINNLFSDSVTLFDAFFFKFIEPARALNNTAIFAGSCGVIRRSALDGVGGFPEYVIEDTFFSFESDMNDYKSLYIPRVYALGEPVKSFTELARQQWRYNYGDTQFIGYFLSNNKKSKLSPLSNMDYITHGFGLNYISVTLILFTIISIFLAFSAIPNLTLEQILDVKFIFTDLEYFGAIALTLSIVTPVLLTKIYFNSVKKGIMLFILNFALAFVRTKAAIAAVFKRDPAMHWNRYVGTNKNKLFYALSNSAVEVVFSCAVIVLSIVATVTNHSSGGIWLVGYGVMYMFATILLYKYG